MALDRILRRLAAPVLAGSMAAAGLSCDSSTEAGRPAEENISARQEELVKPGSVEGSPKIRYTFAPPIGSFSNVSGRIYNANPDSTRVTAYVHAAGGWWVKPTYAEPLTRIRADGTFAFDYTTGGVDQLADRINAYLVKLGYIPAGNTLPQMSDPKVLAGVTINRQ